MSTDEQKSALATRPSLLLRIRDSGDAEAWRTFVDIYGPVIFRYCRRRGLQDADAADVTQDVLAQVAQSIRSFEYRPERGRFRGWLGTVTHNKMLRFQERVARSVRGEGGDRQSHDNGALAEEGADSEWTEWFNAEVLRIALERVRPNFEPETWRAFELVWIEDRSAADAASMLGRPVYTIYLAKSRVLSRLREEVLMLAEDSPILPTTK